MKAERFLGSMEERKELVFSPRDVEQIHVRVVRQRAQQLLDVISELLSEDPTFFVEVITNIFAPHSRAEDVAPTDEERQRASMSFRLLSSWRGAPGSSGGVIDSAKLQDWVRTARKLLRDADRAEVGDQKIGEHWIGQAKTLKTAFAHIARYARLSKKSRPKLWSAGSKSRKSNIAEWFPNVGYGVLGVGARRTVEL